MSRKNLSLSEKSRFWTKLKFSRQVIHNVKLLNNKLCVPKSTITKLLKEETFYMKPSIQTKFAFFTHYSCNGQPFNIGNWNWSLRAHIKRNPLNYVLFVFEK